MVYFTKSDSETESEEDGDEAPKKRSFEKKANAIDSDSDEFEDADDEEEYIDGRYRAGVRVRGGGGSRVVYFTKYHFGDGVGG